MTTQAERARQGVLADLAAAIERAAADLALAEEPAGFPTALEAGAASEPDPPTAESPARG